MSFFTKKFKSEEEKQQDIIDVFEENDDYIRKAEEIKNLPPEELAKLLKELLHNQDKK